MKDVFMDCSNTGICWFDKVFRSDLSLLHLFIVLEEKAEYSYIREYGIGPQKSCWYKTLIR